MSGALAQYRPASKPLFDDNGLPVWKMPRDPSVPGSYPWDRNAIRVVLSPGGTWKKGRCQDYKLTMELKQRHEHVPAVEQNRPSKHARGRIRPRTAREQSRYSRAMARAVQAGKSMTIDVGRLGVIYDEALPG